MYLETITACHLQMRHLVSLEGAEGHSRGEPGSTCGLCIQPPRQQLAEGKLPGTSALPQGHLPATAIRSSLHSQVNHWPETEVSLSA